MFRIAYVINNLASQGGAERVVAACARGLRKAGHKVAIVSLLEAGPLGETLREEGIVVEALDLRELHPRRLRPVLTALVRVLKRLDPEIVHAHLFLSHFYASMASAWLGKAYLVSEQNLPPRRPLWVSAYCRLTQGSVRRWIGVSNPVCRDLVERVGIRTSRVTCIRNCVALESLRGISRTERLGTFAGVFGEEARDARGPVILNLGRLTRQKGQDLLIRAVALLVERGLDPRLYLAGDGAQRDSLESLVRELGLEGIVFLTGYRPDGATLLNACDIFAFPSRWEGLGLALAEALAAGRPAIASKLDVFADFVEAEDAVRFCEVEDVRELADVIESVWRDYATMESRALARIETARSRLSSDRMVEEHLKLYGEVIRR